MGIGKKIDALASARNIKLKELSRRANISYNTLYAIVKRDSQKVDPETLERIAEALDTTVFALMGINSEIGLIGRESDFDRLRYKLIISHYKHLDLVGRDCILEILGSIKQLNSEGANEAVKRIEELTHIEKYTDKDSFGIVREHLEKQIKKQINLRIDNTTDQEEINKMNQDLHDLEE